MHMGVFNMIETKEIEVTERVMVAKTCNMCGTTFKCDGPDEWEAQEFIHLYQHCGYGSIFGDDNIMRIDLCQHCLLKIINHFKIEIEYE